MSVFVSGLCGDFDGDSSNEFMLQNGTIGTIEEFAAAWK